jgi:hypothetical protein
MKKIINGRMYNTETAEQIGTWSSPYGGGDFREEDETLFRKKTGEFFLHGMGGPMTKYGRSCGDNSSCRGEKTIPICLQDAKRWVEEKLSTETYVEVFGEPEE